MEGFIAGQHAFAEGSIEADWLGEVVYAAGKPEGNELRDGQLYAGSEGISKVDHDYFACAGLNEEVLEMPVSDSEDVSN